MKTWITTGFFKSYSCDFYDIIISEVRMIPILRDRRCIPLQKAQLITILCFLLITVLSGCSEKKAEDIYLNEAPGIRITAEAMEALTADGEAHTLSYTIRSS